MKEKGSAAKVFELMQEVEQLKRQVAILQKWQEKEMGYKKKFSQMVKIPSWISEESVEPTGILEYPLKGIDDVGYTQVYYCEIGKWMRLSRAKYIAHFGMIPDEIKIYHKDGNPYNSNINNLYAMTDEEHQQFISNKKEVNC